MVLELGTDWIKFCLIMKFSELPASTLEVAVARLHTAVRVAVPSRASRALRDSSFDLPRHESLSQGEVPNMALQDGLKKACLITHN